MVDNDISARKWQRNPEYAGNIPQWCFSKGFDGFCPMGPMIVSRKVRNSTYNPASCEGLINYM